MPKPLVMVLGPTGAGKSALAMAIAQRSNGEIVNCDSLQLYRCFDVGTAKPVAADRASIPHHLIDILDPEEQFSAGEYVRLARPLLEDIASRGRLPVVVGGTGFYARALLDGLAPAPSRDPVLRQRLTAIVQRRPAFLHRALSRLDPHAASRIHPNDKPKLIRAIEVCLSARRPMTELFESGRDALTGFLPLKLALNPPRDELNYKLNQRCIAMVEAGLIQEVALLLLSGISPQSKPFASIGYAEILDYLTGRSAMSDCLELMQTNTRRYAKRQMTWLRRERECNWLSGFGADPALLSSAINMLVKYMQDLV